MAKVRCSVFAVAVFLLPTVVTSMAYADIESSYEQLSPNGKYVFVMLAKGQGRPGSVDTLGEKYPSSGLYMADNKKKRLWRVNWYSPRVHVSSDGVHLIRLGRPFVSSINGKPNMSENAISFYKGGVIMKKYTVGDLVRDPKKLVKTKSGFKWQERIGFDDSSSSIEITLVTGQKNVFSIKTGNVVSIKLAASKRR